MSLALPATSIPNKNVATRRLSMLERVALLCGIVEIPVQLDKYFMFHERDADLGAVGGFNVSITSVCLAFLYVSWFAQSSVSRNQETPHKPIIGIPMLAYLITIAFSALAAQLPMLSAFDLFLTLQAYALFFYIANRIRTRDDVVFCILALAATLMLQSVFIFGSQVIMSPGEERSIGPILLSVWDDGRPTGTMQSAVLAGSTLALIWLPIASLVMCRPARKIWLVAAFTIFCGLLAILLTQTRGAILTTVCGSSILGFGLLVRGWLPKWAIPMAMLLGVLSIYPLYRVIQNRVVQGDSGSATARVHLTQIALEMIQDHPLRGYGAGNCHLAGQKYADQSKYRSEWYYTIHCKYLLVWIETGLLGLVAFVALLGNGLRHGWMAWCSRDRLLGVIGLALMAALLGHMLHMFVDVFNSRTQVQMLWVILGLAAATYKLTRESESEYAAMLSGRFAQ